MSSFSHAELFPNEAFPENPDDVSEELEVPSYWKNHYELVRKLHQARIDELGEDRYLTLAEQQQLAAAIQKGIAAQAEVARMGNRYRGGKDVIIANGLKARHKLVVVNLSFAAYYARASVGKTPPDTDSDIKLPALPGDAKSYVGTYSNIRRLASPFANIDDRTQVAMEAMWEAADNYKVAGKGSFVAFAAWNIQRRLQEHTAIEPTGWYVPEWLMHKYRTAEITQELYGQLPTIRHTTPEGMRTGNHPSIVRQGQHAVSLEEAGSWLAPEEDDQSLAGEQTGLTLADIATYDTTTDGSLFETASVHALQQTVEYVLDTLSDREKAILRLRYGIDGGEPLTLDQIGKIHGLSQERIRQIESKALGRIRYNRLARASLQSYFTTATKAPALSLNLPIMADGTAHVKTQPIHAIKAEEITIDNVPTERPDGLEDWQVFEEEEWEIDLRDVRRSK